ncbi:hypothetical protein CEXT_117011 [Caerostris extrusa]|uniref:Uncharacterized protein n=1 Tax=Caerostris extrusa TaxID=172846 RepID=A0AAV4P3N1_CAEEX|nr:hypothetical protein CEXT_117011 [Caerostris extrusa]
MAQHEASVVAYTAPKSPYRFEPKSELTNSPGRLNQHQNPKNGTKGIAERIFLKNKIPFRDLEFAQIIRTSRRMRKLVKVPITFVWATFYLYNKF